MVAALGAELAQLERVYWLTTWIRTRDTARRHQAPLMSTVTIKIAMPKLPAYL